MSHITTKHADYVEIMKRIEGAKQTGESVPIPNGSIMQFTNHKAVNIYGRSQQVSFLITL